MSTKRVEAIFKESVLQNIRTHWEASGRNFNHHKGGGALKGQMVFEGVTLCTVDHGVVTIENTKGETFFYNAADFYRFKIVAE